MLSWLPLKYDCLKMKVNSAIQHSDDMGCEMTEGWTTGALMYLIFTITWFKIRICSKGVKYL